MSDNFVSVPLCTLAINNNDYQQLTSLILHYGIVEFSKKDEWRTTLNDFEIDATDEDFALWAYDRVFNFTGASGKRLINSHSIVEKHVQTFENRYGNDAYFRIGKDLLFDAYKGNFSEREFRIYCAIRSVLGAKSTHTRITKERISYRMFGFKNKESFQESNIIIPFSDKQITATVNKLIDRSLIASLTYKNRFTYYSTRLNIDELIEAVAKSVKQKIEKKLSQKEIEQKMNDIITA